MVKIDFYLSLEDIILKVLNKKEIKEASEILKNDGILAFPTETVYGLGVKADKEENYNHLVKVKNRAPDKPFTLMFSNLKQVEPYLNLDDIIVRKIIDKFMPGPLTLIVKAKKYDKDGKIITPDYMDLKTGFIGIRMPNDEFVLKLIDEVGKPLFVPSCNKSGESPCKNTSEVIKVFSNEIDGVIDGECKNGIPSTVLKIENGNLTILRQGIITKEEILRSIK